MLEEALAEDVVAEAVLEEALAEDVVAEAVLEEALIEDVVAEAVLEEALAEDIVEEAVLEEALVEHASAAVKPPRRPRASPPTPAVPAPVRGGPRPHPAERSDPRPAPEPPRASPGAASTTTAPSRCARRTAGESSASSRTARPKRRSPTTSASTRISRAEVGLLEVRQRRGGASAADLRSAARAVNAKLDGAAAVGDLASLSARVAALTQTLAAASETEAAAAREAVDDAVRTRTELVEKIEAIAARDPRSVQWKQASAEVSALFDQWQSQQQHGPRLPKSTAQQLWKRFRDARATFDKHRREFYAELDEAHKGVRERKTRLVEKAEALAPKGEDGIPAYRELLDEWKSAGRAGKKIDDALWARFKAAGDALYSARIERETADAEASREKIEAKRALLEEARAVADEREITKARTCSPGSSAVGRDRAHLPARRGADPRRRAAQDRAGAAHSRGDGLEAQQP